MALVCSPGIVPLFPLFYCCFFAETPNKNFTEIGIYPTKLGGARGFWVGTVCYAKHLNFKSTQTEFIELTLSNLNLFIARFVSEQWDSVGELFCGLQQIRHSCDSLPHHVQASLEYFIKINLGGSSLVSLKLERKIKIY